VRGTLLGLGLALGCALASKPENAPEQAATQAEPQKRPSFDQRSPRVGDPAPPLSLDTLAGERVTLPMSDADRAAILIFGSFS
jgi:hypothetical protein